MTVQPQSDCFQIAHLNISDAAIIVVFAHAAFDADTPAERQRVYMALGELVRRTNPGTDIALLWQDSASGTKFIAPVQQHRFFEIAKYDQLYAQADGILRLTPG